MKSIELLALMIVIGIGLGYGWTLGVDLCKAISGLVETIFDAIFDKLGSLIKTKKGKQS